MRAEKKRRYREESRTRKETSVEKAEMERTRVVGDRTTGKFMCSESGIPRCVSERQPGVRALIGARKRHNGRGAKEGRKVEASNPDQAR